MGSAAVPMVSNTNAPWLPIVCNTDKGVALSRPSAVTQTKLRDFDAGGDCFGDSPRMRYPGHMNLEERESEVDIPAGQRCGFLSNHAN